VAKASALSLTAGVIAAVLPSPRHLNFLESDSGDLDRAEIPELYTPQFSLSQTRPSNPVQLDQGSLQAPMHRNRQRPPCRCGDS
jgi:hypothetical protein